MPMLEISSEDTDRLGLRLNSMAAGSPQAGCIRLAEAR